MGRTQLQDAVPMTLGQEFEAFAATLAGEVRALERSSACCARSTWAAPRSAPASTPPRLRPERATAHLAKITGLPVPLAENLIEATQDTQAFVL